MALSGKLVKQISIKSDGDVFHEIFRDRPHHVSDMSPQHIESVQLHDGQWGAVGSIISWHYFHNGKKEMLKEIIESMDEEKKSVRWKVIEGDVMEFYKSFYFNVHVDTKGEDNLVTWTLDYEKVNENYVADPNSMMEILINLTKDIETHHLKP